MKFISLWGKRTVNISEQALYQIGISVCNIRNGDNSEVDVGLVVVNIRSNASGQNNVFNLKRSKSLLRLFNKEIGNVEQALDEHNHRRDYVRQKQAGTALHCFAYMPQSYL